MNNILGQAVPQSVMYVGIYTFEVIAINVRMMDCIDLKDSCKFKQNDGFLPGSTKHKLAVHFPHLPEQRFVCMLVEIPSRNI